MYRTACTLVALAAVALSAGQAPAADDKPDFYVSPAGDDANPGTLDKPLATLQAARDAVRKLRTAPDKRNTPIIVEFAPGFYQMPGTVVFEPQDSGTEASPTIYRAAKGRAARGGAAKGAAAGGDEVVLSGGRTITGWKPDDKGRWTVQLPETECVQDDLTCSELWDAYVAKKTLKLPTEGKWEFSQLFVNGERRYRPRHPKEGYLKIPAPGPPDEFGAKFPSEGTNAVAGGAAQENWHNLKDVEFVLMNGWNTGRYRISAVKAGTFWITGPGAGGVWWNGIIAQRRYFLVNIFDLIEPGQFYLDRKKGLLTYHPLPGETPDKCTVIAPRVTRLVEFKGDLKNNRPVQYLRFEGLTFAHANWNLIRGIPKGGRGLPQAELDVDAAIKATALCHTVFKNVTMRNIGQYALRLDVGCKNNLVEDCEFVDLGGGGIWLGSTHNGGWGMHDDLPEVEKLDEKTGKKEMAPMDLTEELAASHNTIRNCLVARVGRLHAGSVGIWIGQAHSNLIEHCEIYDCFYTGMNIGWCWGSGPTLNHDNIIQYNLIHLIGQGVLADLGAIYTLGQSKGTVIRNSVLRDIWAYRDNQGCGFYNDQGSRFHRFEHNLVVNASDGAYHNHQSRDIILDNNIFALNKGTLKMTLSGPFTFTHNIVYWNQGYLTKGGAKIDMHHNLWSRGGPKGDRDSVSADPMFVDPGKGDFRLQPGSPAEKIGFKPFDYTKAGRLEGFKRGKDLPPERSRAY